MVKKKMQYSSGYDYVMTIGEQLGQYAGKWIIVYDDKIVDSNENLIGIYNKFKKDNPDKNPFVMKVVKEANMLL